MKYRLFQAAIVAVSAAIFSTQAAAFPTSKVCTASGDTFELNVKSAVSWMLRGVELAAVDGPDDGWGVSQAEITDAIVERCVRCEQTDHDLLNDRSGQFSEILAGLNPRYAVVFSNAKLEQAWSRMPEDRRMRLVLSGRTRGMSVRCLGKVRLAKRKPPSTELPAVRSSGFRLTGKREDLSGSRVGISSARFSVVSDFRAKDKTWLIDGYAGYHHEFTGSGVRGGFTPFVYLSQKESNRRRQLVDKIGVGGDLKLEGADLGRFQLGGMYLSDGKLDKEILTAKLSWWPSLPQGPYWNQYSPLTPDREVYMRLDWKALFDFNAVLNRGDALRLADNEEYGLLGAQARLRLRGDSGPLENFELDALARYQEGVFGSVDHIYRVEALLKYFFPGQKNFSIGVDYSYGHRPQTWVKEHLLEFVLGARF